MQPRKGFVNTLESVFAVLMILGFVSIALPKIHGAIDAEKSVRESFGNGLETLDKRGVLRQYAFENLAAIKAELDTLVTTTVNFTVGATKSNDSPGTIDFSESINGTAYRGNLTFSVDESTKDSVSVTLTFFDSNNADFYMNKALIGIRDTSTNTSKLDITDRTFNGTNKFSVVSTASGSANYTVDTQTFERLSGVPTNATINVISYFLAGTKKASG